MKNDSVSTSSSLSAGASAIGDNPNDALNLLMSGVVKTLEAAALFTLDAAKAVIATLMDLIREVIEAVRALIFAEWEIPVVSQLYKLFTGRTLSIRMVQIISYLVAIPATLIYKLATKTAPFPDQGALDAYKNYVSVDWLKSKFGIATERQVVFDAKQETVVACVSLGIYSGAMVARILTDTLVGFLNATNLAAAGDLPARVQAFKGRWTNPQNVAVASIVLRLVTTFATTPWLIRPNIPGPQCPAGQPGFSPIIWMCQIVFGPFRGLLLLAAMPPSVTRINVSEATLSAWGIAQTTMVVWNYVAAKDYSLLPTLGLTRALTNIIPGQVTRFTFIPNIQGPYFIPMIIGEVLIVVGYLGSVGIAVWELVEIAKADDTLILEHV